MQSLKKVVGTLGIIHETKTQGPLPSKLLQHFILNSLAVHSSSLPVFIIKWSMKRSLLKVMLMHMSKGIMNLPTSSLHLCSPLQQKRSGFTINSPLFQNNWVKIHHRKNKVGWRFTKFQVSSGGMFKNEIGEDSTIPKIYILSGLMSNLRRSLRTVGSRCRLTAA